MSPIQHTHNSQAAPFTIPVLSRCDGTFESDTAHLSSLLPAIYRDDQDNLTDPASCNASILRCIDTELDLNRLSELQAYLWMAGRPIPPRPLHHQQLLGRGIQITERMDMHLVWRTSAIFIKPIPRFLLDPQFWHSYICCKVQRSENCRTGESSTCECQQRWRRAFGFLVSYAALISYESDFRIAQEKYLLPPELTWSAWRTLITQLLNTKNIYSHVDPRFHYGELRLNRLNKGHYFWKFRPYKSHWNQYSSFLRDNFMAIAAWSVYVIVVLTAMQVGLATETLQGNTAFQAASYGFTVFSILGPLISASCILLVFIYFFISNWIATRMYWRKRMALIMPCSETKESTMLNSSRAN